MRLTDNHKLIDLMTVPLIDRTLEIVPLVVDVADSEGGAAGAFFFAADGAVDLWAGCIVVEGHAMWVRRGAEDSGQESESEGCETGVGEHFAVVGFLGCGSVDEEVVCVYEVTVRGLGRLFIHEL